MLKYLSILLSLFSQLSFGAIKADIPTLRSSVDQLTSIGSRYAVSDRHEFKIINPNAQVQKIEFIEAALQSYGYNTSREYFTASQNSGLPGSSGINIIAEKKGLSNKTIELGAHYDTAGSPGADDNISGTAGVLEVARILANQDTSKSIRFILYDLEEIGLQGSRHHVKQILDRKEKIEGVYVFEMIGYTNQSENSQQSPVRIPGI